jgi:CO dehydrogenase maturation factor
LLNHCADEPGTYVVVDMTAGADSFASGLFTRFDLTLLVVEPTKKSLGVYQQYKHYTDGHHVKLKVIANKVVLQDDLTFIRDHVGNDLLAWVSQSDYIRAMEKGKILPFSSIEIENRDTLAAIKRATDDCEQDWDTFYQQAVEFHRKNAVSWMNAALGEDVAEQIDPDFSLSSEIKRWTEGSIQKGLSYVS